MASIVDERDPHDDESPGPLFAALPEEASAALLSAATSREVGRGTTLFHQGDPPTHLHQIVSGLAKLTQINADGVPTTLRVMGPGDLLGCVAVLQQFPYPATSTALNDTVVMSWRAEEFSRLMSRHPSIVESTLRIVGARTKEMVDRVVAMSGSVEQRIANALQRLAAQGGTRTAHGIEIGLPVTREHLAEMAGVTYFTLSRTLSSWQRRGLITSGRQRIVIVAASRLAEMAEGRPASGSDRA
ncbi:MAG: Crp/Fnr family transcriptional regulator [Hyphomicrobiales bacterium]|nr:Crp/Fnr family transcriptional regulator [Hyphomicrobiales bacterium]